MSRGVPIRTPERVAEAIRLREEGLTWREIGGRLGVALSTAQEWGTDPDGAKRDARKAGYRGECVDCGKPTDGSDPRAPSERCAKCIGAHTRAQTRRWVMDSFAEWFDMFGVPPTATDWNLAQARATGQRWRAERAVGTGRPWPNPRTVIDNFGTWNAAVREAGFEPFAMGCYGRDGEDPAVVEETVRLYRTGLSCAAVGALMGVSWQGVQYRLVKAGEPRRKPARAKAAA